MPRLCARARASRVRGLRRQRAQPRLVPDREAGRERAPNRGGRAMSRAEIILPPQDSDANEIGDLYRKGKSSMIDSVRYLIEAGQRLTAKKNSLRHGEWLLC